MTNLTHKLMECLALNLGLDANYLVDHYAGELSYSMSLAHYPPIKQSSHENEPKNWSFSEYTDYNSLTILKQDNIGGLQVCIIDRYNLFR